MCVALVRLFLLSLPSPLFLQSAAPSSFSTQPPPPPWACFSALQPKQPHNSRLLTVLLQNSCIARGCGGEGQAPSHCAYFSILLLLSLLLLFVPFPEQYTLYLFRCRKNEWKFTKLHIHTQIQNTTWNSMPDYALCIWNNFTRIHSEQRRKILLTNTVAIAHFLFIHVYFHMCVYIFVSVFADPATLLRAETPHITSAKYLWSYGCVFERLDTFMLIHIYIHIIHKYTHTGMHLFFSFYNFGFRNSNSHFLHALVTIATLYIVHCVFHLPCHLFVCINYYRVLKNNARNLKLFFMSK